MVKENIIPATETVAELKDEYKTPRLVFFSTNHNRGNILKKMLKNIYM